MIKMRVSNRSQNNMGEITKSTRAYALPTQSQPIALSTEFTYDSWGRMLQIVYPDGEILNYGYDRGGQLKSMQGVKDSCTYNYLIDQKYDKFGAKTEMAYGNYMVTKYIYNPLNLRLDSLAVSLQLNNYLTMGYDYDAKGNVTSLNSTYTWLSNDSIIRQTFTYDSTDQLTAAMGKINNRTSLYNVAVTYGNWGKIRGYTTSMNGTDTFMYPTTNLTSTHFAPESSVNNGQTTIYDFGINGSLRKKAKGDTTEYYLFNANNCMKAYSNNAEQYAYYGYDASGERTYKLSANTITISTNGLITVQALDVQNIMLYPNGYLNINQSGEYTKHYYADALRIASKIGSGFNQDICDSANAIDSAYLNNRILEQNTVIQNNLYEVALTDSIDTLILSNPYPDFCYLQGNGGQETGLFYYHPDHLGSTGMVTDNNATVTQGFLYAPFGEILTEYNPSWQNGQVPKYSFNAKELDEENGMYYYSARYYAPPTFISRDPLFEKYPSISPYCYTANNPLKFVDPTGEEINVSSLSEEVQNKLIASLSKITGLNVGVKTEKGLTMLTYTGSVNEEGTSSTAREMLMNAIKDERIVDVCRGTEKGSMGGELQIQYDEKQIQGFIDGVKGGLNPETMGFGMVFLHELDHTDLGITKSRDGEKGVFGVIGSTIKLMNTIRSELGSDYGQRLSHASKNNPTIDDYQYIPFDKSSLEWLKKGFNPLNGNRYIQTK